MGKRGSYGAVATSAAVITCSDMIARFDAKDAGQPLSCVRGRAIFVPCPSIDLKCLQSASTCYVLLYYPHNVISRNISLSLDSTSVLPLLSSLAALLAIDLQMCTISTRKHISSNSPSQRTNVMFSWKADNAFTCQISLVRRTIPRQHFL